MITYENGNTKVTILEDGTKIRYTPDGQTPRPEFPESIDLKITNKCDLGCPMCHEKARKNGLSADLKHPLLASMRRGMELAIGGGNPLENDGLYDFLQRMQRQGVICNMTVHHTHFAFYCNTIYKWQKEGLIHGLGVSVNGMLYSDLIDAMRKFPNVVVHVIAGIVTPDVLKQFDGMNLLILGYKNFGRGKKYKENHDIEPEIKWLADNLFNIAGSYRAFSFDNLAIEQLGIRQRLTEDGWSRFYMGDDGKYTMYVDLVRNEFAKSSVSTRMPINSNYIEELFRQVRQ